MIWVGIGLIILGIAIDVFIAYAKKDRQGQK